MFPTSHSQPPPLSFLQAFPASHPACFYIPSAPLLCPFLCPPAQCVMPLLCESEHFVHQPNCCNVTPLTWESQQSVVIVGETCLEAAVLSFSESKWAPWKTWTPQEELWLTCVAQIGYSLIYMVKQRQSFSFCTATATLVLLCRRVWSPRDSTSGTKYCRVTLNLGSMTFVIYRQMYVGLNVPAKGTTKELQANWLCFAEYSF